MRLLYAAWCINVKKNYGALLWNLSSPRFYSLRVTSERRLRKVSRAFFVKPTAISWNSLGRERGKKKKKITSNRKPCPFIASATFNHWCKQTILHRACESTCAQSSLNYLKVLGIEIKDGGRKKRTEKFNIKEDVLYFLSTPARYPPHTHTRTGTDPWANAVIYMLRYCLRLTYPTSEAASIWQDRRASRFPWCNVCPDLTYLREIWRCTTSFLYRCAQEEIEFAS